MASSVRPIVIDVAVIEAVLYIMLPKAADAAENGQLIAAIQADVAPLSKAFDTFTLEV